MSTFRKFFTLRLDFPLKAPNNHTKIMKTQILKVILPLFLLLSACDFIDKMKSGPKKASDLKTQAQKESYFIGHNIGQNIAKSGASDLDIPVFTAALKQGLKGGESLLTPKETMDIRIQMIQKSRKTRAKGDEKSTKDNLNKGQEFLKENKMKEGIKVTSSGLQYQIIKEGKGKQPAGPESQVEVHYKGTLVDGTEFDSSYKRNQTATFRLNQVIRGWTEGLQLMKEGATYKFVIPPELGYGAQASGQIPANSVLIFEVELIAVK